MNNEHEKTSMNRKQQANINAAIVDSIHDRYVTLCKKFGKESEEPRCYQPVAAEKEQEAAK